MDVRPSGRQGPAPQGNTRYPSRHFAFVNELPGQKGLVAEAALEIDSGFDIVIGNPPYVRIQTLKKKDPELVAFFKQHYASAARGNYDLYVVFIEAGLSFLRSDGHLAYICPHKFFNAQYGEPLRTLIAEGKHLRHVIHFGDEQVFAGATIYTCLLFLQRSGAADCRFVEAHDLAAWRENLAGTVGMFAASRITASEWNFVVGKGADVFNAMATLPRKLADVANVFVGLQTSADDVFIMDFDAHVGAMLRCRSKSLDQTVASNQRYFTPSLAERMSKASPPFPTGS